ncbi:PAS domain-containing protein [Streptomyces sp. NPDC017435]|uniref:PAS domain-containing protein n=1 Tax=Streptomyces sp. NPDC017435 TaxID=3364995 RepID=UPI00378ABC04
MSKHPSSEQLLDLFNWASPGMLVTDADGTVVLANKAATELLRDKAAAGSRLPDILGIDGHDALVKAGTPVENLEATFTNPEFPSGYANVGFGSVDGTTYGFWALRPVTTHPSPSPVPGEGSSTAQAWIDQVDRSSESYTPAGEDAVAFIKAYYDNCPVAIHLIEEDGTVAHANWKDIAIVGASEQPDTYVGRHIHARAIGAAIPLGSVAAQFVASAVARGEAELDHSALLRGVELLSGYDHDLVVRMAGEDGGDMVEDRKAPPEV